MLHAAGFKCGNFVCAGEMTPTGESDPPGVLIVFPAGGDLRGIRPRSGRVCLRSVRVGTADATAMHTATQRTTPIEQIHNDMIAGRLEDAERGARAILKLKPREPVASYLLGLTLSRMGRLDEAEFHLRTPAELPGAQRDCQCEYGRVLCDLGKFTAGVEFLRRATQTDLTSAYAWESLAKGLHQAGLYADAVNAGEEAVRCAARSKSPYGGAGVMKTVGISWAAMADASEAVKWHARAMQEAPGDVMISAAWSYLLNYLDVSPNDATTALSRITECMHQRGGITPFRAPSNFERGVRPLRVGLLTPDLRDHPVSRFMLPLLANTEASRCRYSVYYTHPARDLVSKRCSRYVERWHQVAHLDDEAVARLIRADEPDVLIDLAGWTADSRVTLFASLLAPVQVSYLGYPNLTGVPGTDVRLADRTTDPDALMANAWSPGMPETVVAMPGPFLCWEPPAERVISKRPAGQPPTFGSFNYPGKISPRCGRLWARLLATVPHSKLLLKGKGFGDPATRATVMQSLRRHGIEPSRVELRGTCPSFADHLEAYNGIDVALDPFPYNGTTTTCEALWMGVPVVTLAGSTHAGRVGASIMSTLEMYENICQDENAYVQRASALVSDGQELSKLRATLRDRLMDSHLCNGPDFAQRFITTLETLAERTRHL
jgi:protein O-GlcNAc transferase